MADFITGKQPFEEIDLEIDFVNRAPAGSTLAGLAITSRNKATNADTSAAIIAASPVPAISGTKAQWRVKAGASGETHIISIRVTANPSGQKLEGDVELVIREG